MISKDDTTSGVAFQLAPNHQPPAWPNPDRPQQFHLDVMVDDIVTAEPRVIALGARPLAGGDHVYADPAGHPFCPHHSASVGAADPFGGRGRRISVGDGKGDMPVRLLVFTSWSEPADGVGEARWCRDVSLTGADLRIGGGLSVIDPRRHTLGVGPWLAHVSSLKLPMLGRVATDGITAVKTRSTFRMQCAVSTEIKAAPEKIWALLTRADDMVRWNSTLTNVEVEPVGP